MPNKQAYASYSLIGNELGLKTESKRAFDSFEQATPKNGKRNVSIEDPPLHALPVFPGADSCMMFQLLSAAKVCRHRMAQFCQKNYGLEPNLFLILSAASEGHLQQGLLATSLGINKNAMVFLIDNLEVRRLIRRVPNPDNRRERFVECTSKGKQIVAETKASYPEIARWGLYPLTELQVEQLKELLTQLIEGHQLLPCPLVRLKKAKCVTTPSRAIASRGNGADS